MKRLALLIVALFAAPAHASISVAVTGSGSLTNTYEGNVTFPQIGFTDAGTITEWSITGLDPVVKTVTYGTSDLDFIGAFGSGFRWAEIITNDSTDAWMGYTITLTDTSGTFSTLGNFLNTDIAAFEVPGFADIDMGVFEIEVNSTLGTPTPPDGRVMTLSANQLQISMSFPDPIAPGDSFAVHIPIENLGAGTAPSFSFELTQQAVPTPEPSTLVAWSVLGAIGVVVVGIRLVKQSAAQQA
jgi:hypothetical protein